MDLSFALKLNKMLRVCDIFSETEKTLGKATKEFTDMCKDKEKIRLLTEKNPDNPDDNEDVDPELKKLDQSGLRKLYYKMARKLHPDKGGHNENSETMAKVTHAYKSLNLLKLIVYAKDLGQPLDVLDRSCYPLLDANFEELIQQLLKKYKSHLWEFSKKTPEEKKIEADRFWGNVT